MPNEFLVKNGLISQGNVTVTGSLTTSQGDIIVNYNSTSSNSVFRTFATSHATGNRNASLAFGLYDGALSAMTVVNTASSNPSFNSQYISFATHEGGINVGERMRITPLGNVGIGTINPTATLQIVGSVLATSFTGSLSGSITNALTASYLTTANSYIVTNLTASNISASGTGSFGYVGIGTTNPGSRLTVSGSIESLTDNGGEGGQLILRGNTYRYNIDNFNGQALRFFREDDSTTSNGVTYMMISASGNVGIGTTVPNSKLEVAGTAGTGVVSVTNTGNGRSGSFGIDGNGVYIQNSNNGDYFDLKNATGTSRFRVVYDNNTYLNTTYTSVGSLTASGSKLSVFGNLSVGSTYGSTSSPTNGAIFEGKVGIGTTSLVTGFLDVRSNTSKTATATNVVFFGSNDASNPLGLIINHESSSGVKMVGLVGTEYGASGNNIKINEVLTVQYNGFVGIGTVAPTSKLHISGSGSTTITITDDALYTNSITNDNSVMTYTVDTGNAAAGSAAHIFKRYTTELVRIDPSGNVGIGTSIPNNRLDIVGATGTTLNMSNVDDGNRGGKLTFISSSATGRQFYVGTNSSIYNLVFGIDSIEKMRLDTSGNLGIGTSSPGSKLQINDNTPVLTIRANDGGTSRKAYIDFYTTFFNYPSDVGARRTSTIVTGFDSGTWGTEFLAFNVGSGSANDAALLPIERVRIDGSGNLGIGTSRPATKLDVKGHIFVANAANGNNTIAFGNIGGLGPLNGAPDNLTGSAFLVVSSSTASGAPSHMKFYTTTGGVCGERMRIDESGNVGIGTTAPSAIVDIQGTNITTYGGGNTGSLGTIYLSGNDAYNSGTAGSGIYFRGKFDAAGTTRTTFGAISAIKENNTDGAFDGALTFFARSGSNAGIIPERMRISSVGNVGIGTTGPTALLELSSSTVANLFNIKGARGNNILYVSGSGNIGINSVAFDPLAPESLLISGSTYNIISADTNINTYGQVHTQNRNAGTAASSDLVSTNDTGNEVGNYVDMGINSSGYTAGFIGNANDGYLYNTGSQFFIGNASPGRNLYFFAGGTSNTASMMLSASGNVGIGATSPNAKLDVRGYIVSDVNGNAVESGFYLGSSAHGIRRPVASNDVYLHTTTGNLYLGTTGNTSQQVTVLNSGNVGIGTVTPAAKLEITGSSNSALLNIKSPISGAILYVSGSGAVGIGTSNVGAFTLQVSGSFGATTKSFIIDHPTKAGKKLMYGSLESPYHGIRLTGRDTLVNGKCKVELPDYIYKLILHDSVNIQLTGIKCNKTLYVDDINIPENYFTIAYDKAIFESYKDYEFFWDFTAIRADVPELTTEL